jgi:choline dehydrogenase-like flavoprotein
MTPANSRIACWPFVNEYKLHNVRPLTTKCSAYGRRHRPRYPYRAHEINSAAKLLARGCEALGYSWTETPLATVSAPRGKSPPCAYRGFCRFGCSTNAKQSALIVWIPRALKAGAKIRDLAMVGRIETDAAGRAIGVHYHRSGTWRFQRARNVVVAGYAIETPRLLLNSANTRFPDGLANSSGLVGRNLMTQSNKAAWGRMDDEVRWYKGPPSLAITEHWNYEDRAAGPWVQPTWRLCRRASASWPGFLSTASHGSRRFSSIADIARRASATAAAPGSAARAAPPAAD